MWRWRDREYAYRPRLKIFSSKNFGLATDSLILFANKMMLRRPILIEPELSEPKAYTKEKKFSFSGEQKEKPFWVLIFLLPG